MRRVVVTGLGCVAPIGQCVPDFWNALVAGRSAIGKFPEHVPEQIAHVVLAPIVGFNADAQFEPKRQLPFLDRFSQFALLAAREAARDAGLVLSDSEKPRSAVVLGSGIGGNTTHEEQYQRLAKSNNPRVHPLTIPRLMLNAAASQVTMEFGMTGPAYSISSACASANHAIGQAMWFIRSGLCDVALTGGSEACLTIGTVKAWEALRVMASDTCRPFAKDRRGMVLGEGGAIIVIESLERASARGAKIYCELAGFGMSSDADDITFPNKEGAASAMTAALKDGGLNPADVDYINAHGTGTAANDKTETAAIKLAFKDEARRLAVSSTKSMHGHALGAAGAIEIIAAVKAIETGIVPPTANFTEPDPECDLDYVPNKAREMKVRAALSNSFAFGGLNAVLALRAMN
jgi:nodulation protein E